MPTRKPPPQPVPPSALKRDAKKLAALGANPLPKRAPAKKGTPR